MSNGKGGFIGIMRFIKMEDSIYDRKRNSNMHDGHNEIALVDGLQEIKGCEEETDGANDPFFPVKRRKGNYPTLELLADVVEATSRCNNDNPEIKTEFRSDIRMRFGHVFTRNTNGNGSSRRLHVRSSEESQADSKCISSETSVAAQLSLCSEGREVEIEKSNPETEGESQAKQSADLTKVGLSAPVVRTSRGRTQTLPSRFRDSVIEPWKKSQTKGLKLNSSKRPRIRFKGPDLNLELGMSQNGMKHQPQITISKNEKQDTKSSNILECESNTSKPSAPDKHFTLGNLDCVPSFVSRDKTPGIVTGGLHPLEEFDVGDIVWAKSGKRNDPAWPAKIIDPQEDAPDAVLSVYAPGRLCVMFFGPSSAKMKERDYAWVKQGMIFPFIEYLDTYQGQTQLNKSKPSDFKMAIQEATLAEYGFGDLEDYRRSRAKAKGFLTDCGDSYVVADVNHLVHSEEQVCTEEKSNNSA